MVVQLQLLSGCFSDWGFSLLCICSFSFKYSYFLQVFTWLINTGVLLIGENVVGFFCLVGVEVLLRFKANELLNEIL